MSAVFLEQRHRGSTLGSSVCAGFGALWSVWASAGLPPAAALVCQTAGLVAGGLVLVIALLRRTSGQDRRGSGDARRWRRYWAVNAAELVLVVAGAFTLTAARVPTLVIVWTAAVVGAHFVVLARWFWRGFAVLGGCVLLGAAAGGLVALWRLDAAVGTTGTIVSVALLVFAAVLVPRRRARRAARPT